MHHLLFLIVWFLTVLCQPRWALQGFLGTQQGLCTENVQVTKSRVIVAYQQYISYMVQERCYRYYSGLCWKTRIKPVDITKHQIYTDYDLQYICCQGFQDVYGECKPLCNPNCENGYCSAINYCTCNNGYKKNETNVCVPFCTNPCQNGICTAPETCTCQTGYVKDNLDSYVCNPFCSGGCQNGKCVGPDICSCLAGYEIDPLDGSVCHPICSNACVNAKCTAPDECSCSDGFIQSVNQSNVCVPHCSKPCKNGLCTAPEECLCYSGFMKNINNVYECDPVCSKACVNGICSAPETCSCLEGYIVDSFDKYTCVPVCSKECKNSRCRAPEICICDQGYIYDQEDSYSCLPCCPEGCINSNCTEPGVCECREGYVQLNDQQNVCKPVCTDCENANCVQPDVCECWDGYEIYSQNQCVPICSSCLYGNCDYPEFCSCWTGYVNPPDSNNTCVPVCDAECVNSMCIAPNKCDCLEGFANVTGDWNSCSPYCSEKCLNGICVNPEECNCLQGYEPDKNDPNSCHPICSNCINGVCTAPGYCNCFWGFQSSENESTCSETLNSMLGCYLEWEFLFAISEESCSDLSMQRQRRPINVIQCPFLETIMIKHFSEFDSQETLTLEFTCSINSTIDDSGISILCNTEEIANNHIRDVFSDVDNISESTPSEYYVVDFSTTDYIDISSSSEAPATITITQEPNNNNSRNLEILSVISYSTTENLYKDIVKEFSQSSTEYEDSVSSQLQLTASPIILPTTEYVKIKLDNLPYIRKYEILKGHFHNVTKVQLPQDLCLCSSKLNGSSCADSFLFRLSTCNCNYKSEAGPYDTSKKGLPFSTVFVTVVSCLLILTTLAIIGGYFHYFRKPEDRFINELEKELKKLRSFVQNDNEGNRSNDADGSGEENTSSL